MTLEEKAKKIKLVVLDVDGVLTDGQIITSSQGELCKHFNVKDGLGIKLMIAAGIDVVIITGRRSAIVGARLRELGVRDVLQGQINKKRAFLDLIKSRRLEASECACMGDDVPDLPVMQLCGLPCAPSDAVQAVLSQAAFVSSRKGGFGAVREMAEAILKAQGKWDQLLDKIYFNPEPSRFR
ncbi:HAD-IIIA family hydrolase [Mesosutterella sp. OilRF-GAM-744-9]|uniref:HAD-IIIA family hydrolase n=1 Tax=Mesosutterella porci TaxID=2915351 RepID=A0ABS9MNP7_9BURK|nr:HAD-IIIA family hydrolase [Mesosutterella sp. oilRF-744-WT-GAM-9]MCG5030239.1 HAD-IIIA family hydrolase [Mesosutterella sp. oilRF-744-WT-GAM-9]MCI6529571.1 HAD-IIIA family hydrolase [Mesosutterella sp.]